MRLDAMKTLSNRIKNGTFENKFKDNVLVAKLDQILSWSRATSPWMFQFGLACCAIEMIATGAEHDMGHLE